MAKHCCTPGDSFTQGVLVALGLQDQGVTKINVKLELNQATRIELEKFATAEQMQKLEAVLKRYRITTAEEIDAKRPEAAQTTALQEHETAGLPQGQQAERL